ncbi:MAG: SusC/RagA family TonB-linked outer membrane protein [Tannerellaceae bacterium]|nr:SusC/RagA family TonB-linked outer membrane protein [Tannerellaceae bacterium]
MLKNKQSIGLILLAGTLCFSGSIHAELAPIKHEAHVSQQSGKITGTVEDVFGPVTGASVMVKGTTNGTITDLDGNFTLENVPDGATILISFIGYVSQEIVYKGQPTLFINLEEDTKLLDEVVVTALGIKREKKALGYAAQELKGDALVSARESNITNALSGKVSGLQVVRSSSGPGGSSKIVLRGYNSLTGSNQPLVVVDGIPIDNNVGGVDDPFGNNGVDTGNGLSDINPEDIESMSVLKGASAAALYGSRAGNGVILITTKSGRKQAGLGITVNAGVTVENRFLKPPMQNVFGQGNDGLFDQKTRNSWGQPVDGSLMMKQDDGNEFAYRAYNNADNFFQTGITFTEGVSIQQNIDGTGVFASVNRSDDKGIIPEQGQKKTSINLRGTTELGPNKRWKLDAKVTYMNTKVTNRPLQGLNQGNVLNTLYNTPITIDMSHYKNSIDELGNMLWFDKQQTPQENPYWVTQYRTNEDTRNRFMGSISLAYKIADWWNLEVKAGTDTHNTTYINKLYAGGNVNPDGNYEERYDNFYENNYSFLNVLNKDNVWKKLGGSFTFGGNIMLQRRQESKTNLQKLLVPNLFTLNNAKNSNDIIFEQKDIQRKMNSLYGSLQLNWDGWLFMDVTGRNDWSSTMSKANRSYFYPSVSLSGVISEMLHKADRPLPSWITFAKGRVSYAQVGNDLDPYQLYMVYETKMDPQGNPVGSMGDILYDPSVRSELVKSWEAGVELKFFDNRLGIDVAWYKSNSTRQLLELDMDPFSGYKKRKVNAGNIQNTGMEFMLYGTIFNNPNGFSWESTVNASFNTNKIIELVDGIEEYGIQVYDGLRFTAPVGGYYGEIYGRKFERVESGEHAGKIIVDNEGLPLLTSDNHYLGNQQPDFMMGWTNSFKYKNISLSFLIDARFGGKIYSATTAKLYGNGMAAGTVTDGKREAFVVPNSVQKSGDSYTTNTTEVIPQKYWNRVVDGNIGLGEAFIYDATNIRLRNLTIGYDLEKKWLKNTPFQRIFVSATANNVWMIHYNLEGIDPEASSATNTNAPGFEILAPPTTRTFTFNVSATF